MAKTNKSKMSTAAPKAKLFDTHHPLSTAILAAIIIILVYAAITVAFKLMT